MGVVVVAVVVVIVYASQFLVEFCFQFNDMLNVADATEYPASYLTSYKVE